ncbi:MAG: hypothetical protein AABZ08_02185 [Planctomycetota bacterium]
MKRRRRLVKVATFLALGGLVTQAGACWIIGANTLLPGVAQGLVDANGRFLGLVNVCGIPNVLPVDVNGIAGELQNGQDDLVTVCPVTVVVEP